MQSASQTASLQAGLGALSGVRQWQAWAAAMIGTLILLLLLHVGLGYDKGINFVIFGLFGVTMFKSWRDISFLERETRKASRQVDQLGELNDIAEFVRVAEPSIFRSHIEGLHTIFLNDSTIDQGSLIEVIHARLMARNKVVELFASVLITLGLIGTIIGLIAAQTGLEGVLDSVGNSSDGLFGEMKKTLTGLATAFETTLFGAVFGGVILRILTSVVDANILNYMAHLSQLTEVHVLPAMRRTAARLEAAGYYRNLGAAPKG
jgi:biopolymer transport protein ExbB/TolQ